MAITVTRTAPLSAPASPSAVTGTATGDLTNGKTYYYRICAITATGSSGLVGVPCAEISATADSNGSIDLSWSAVTGANAYYVWRTPTSGDYALDYNDGGDLSKDTHAMLLNNQKTASTQYTTTTATTLTDIGTTTERSSSQAYYRWWHNHFLYENGRGAISIATSDGDIASFNDIYDDAVTNSYTAFFIKHYDNGGYRIFEAIDDISIDGDFADWNFKVIYHNNFLCSNDSDYSRIFGKYTFFNGTKSYVISGHSELVNYNPVGRKMQNGLNLYYCNCYGLRCYREYGISDPISYASSSDVYKTGSGACSFRGVVLKECTFAGYWQQINVYEYIDMDNVIFEKNHRGFNIGESQENSSYNNVYLNNAQYDTTGNYATTLKNSTFYNGSGAGIHRFYNVDDIDRTLLDCFFPNGTGLPNAASNGGGAVRNTLTLKWSFDLLVVDEDNNPISGAIVKIEDSQGNTISETTDANGVITTQELIQAVYNRATETDGNFDTTTDYNDYTLTISKTGYETYISEFDLTEKTELVITLKTVKKIRQDIDGNVYYALKPATGSESKVLKL